MLFNNSNLRLFEHQGEIYLLIFNLESIFTIFLIFKVFVRVDYNSPYNYTASDREVKVKSLIFKAGNK